MNQKEYIKSLLKNQGVLFSYAGSEFGNDCISLHTNIFIGCDRLTLYMPSMGWENIEEYIADAIDSDIRNNIIRLKLDIHKEAGKRTYIIWDNEMDSIYSGDDNLIRRFPSELDAYDWLCSKYKKRRYYNGNV